MVWALLSRRACTVSDLGPNSALLRQMFSLPSQTVNLSDIPWFIEMLHSWPENEGNGPSDCAEFTSLLMQCVSSDCISCRWEQRVMLGEKVVVHDYGSSDQPITLHMDPELAIDGVVPLKALVRSWHNQLGMHQALVQDRDLLCFHVDRFCHTPQGQLQKWHLPLGVDWGIEVPIFDAQGLEVSWHDFQVIALSSHYGGGDGGHYRTLLKIDMPPLPAAPVSFLHMDDNKRAVPCWNGPDDFYHGINQIWLCKCSALDLHAWPSASHGNMFTQSRREDMIHLLTSS